MHTTYADSAASDHFFIDIVDFESYEPYTGKNGSTTENGRTFTIYGKGNVRKCWVYNGKVITLLFKDVLHCPTLSHNLISIVKLDKGGYYTIFGGGGATFVNPKGQVFMFGSGEGTMYKLSIFPPTGPLPHDVTQPPDISRNFFPILNTQVKVLATKSHNKPTNIDTWHHCLGHVSYNTIQWMSKGNTIQGMHITNPIPCPGNVMTVIKR